jgi:hypothetical protein
MQFRGNTHSNLRVKKFLRNSTGKKGITGLALLSTRRDVSVNPEEVLNQFALQKDRSIILVLNILNLCIKIFDNCTISIG